MNHRDISVRARPRFLAALGGLWLTGGARQVAAQPDGFPPTIVVIVTDDMREDDFAVLARTRELLGEHGTTFPNFFVTTPICAPSRASILTGLYAHNHGVFENGPPPAGWQQFHERGLEEQTVATVLHGAGYHTVLAGKYLNGFPMDAPVPPGWDQFYAAGEVVYTDFELNENGTPVSYPAESGAYSTDVLLDKVVKAIEHTDPGDPLFVYFAPMAPHAPARAAPRHDNAFRDAELATGVSFNEEDILDKPSFLRDWPVGDDEQIAELTRLQRKRRQSLLAVDDSVQAIWDALDAAGRLDTATIMFLSDNGYLLGEHRTVGKQAPYDESARISLLAYGPAFEAGHVDERLVANIDLLPSLAALAGAAQPIVDGEAFTGESRRDAVLIEHRQSPVQGGEDDPGIERGKRRPPTYQAIRTLQELYVEYETGERELYDLEADPHQLENLLADWEGQEPSPGAIARGEALSQQLAVLRDCAGATCH